MSPDEASCHLSQTVWSGFGKTTAPTPWPSASGPHSIDWSPASGLLAGAGSDGVIRLWRLPKSSIQPARVARQIARGLDFDDQHLVDVAGNKLRLISADNGASRRGIQI